MTTYWWGNDRALGCTLANLWNPENASPSQSACDDRVRFTTELGTSKPNEFGLYDMVGNVASWTSDCRGGRPSKQAGSRCHDWVVMGASWATSDPRSAAFRTVPENTIAADLGFRLARDL